MIRTPLLLALLLGTSATGIALAADTPAAPAQRSAKLDTNKDGRISRDEAKADPRLAERFDQLDLNKDGYLDKADRELRMKQHRDAWFAAADTKKDGQLCKAEFDTAKGPMHGGPRHGGPRDGAAPKPQR